MSEKTYYPGLDFGKFIASLMVIMIHVSLFIDISQTAHYVIAQIAARIAVPIFFMSSGFLFAKGITSLDEAASKLYFANYMKRLLYMYGVWSVIMFFLHLYLYSANGDLWGNVRYLLWITVFVGSHGHFWYFPALIFSIFCIYFARKFNLLKAMLAVSAILYVLGLFDDSWYGFTTGLPAVQALLEKYNALFITTRNGLFFSNLIVTMGFLLAGRDKSASKKDIFFALLSFAALFAESLLLRAFSAPRDYNMYLCIVPLSWFTAKSLLLIPESSFFTKARGLALREYATGLYIAHSILFYAVIFLPASVNAVLSSSTVTTYVAIVAASFVIVKIVKIQPFKAVKRLFY